MDDEKQIDALIAAFFQVFDNRHGSADLTALYDMFMSEGIIINNTGKTPAVYMLATFVPTRQMMFENGEIIDFREWEIEAETTVIGSIAHRKTLYGKQGVVRGEHVDSKGHKSFQLIRTDQGWKITALSWWDEA